MRRAPAMVPGWDEFAAELGRALQRRRLERGLSQEQVAYAAGLSRYTYQKYEQGVSRPGSPANPSVRSLMAIAQALGVPLGEILPADPPDLLAR